uniref:peptide-methionine (S)-S-oxide reductase n=1 Tax=Fibrocapsa japonica TaxID=94617 RepID=A0A7S2V104_9STRA|mmetsp:Transcript_22913/g.33228  ORF Transcript_22913/g.33228 Transcript_22913/m.33228 type:complete len:141 (+) Transcript_22913:462-884(+)
MCFRPKHDEIILQSSQSYQAVCTGYTGHAEAVEITFDPSIVTFQELLKVFWDITDPTSINKQGADVGTQYRSGIFYTNEIQKQEAYLSKSMEQQKYTKPVVTEIVMATKFWPAEQYHQKYLERHGQSAKKGNCTAIRCYG